MRDPARWFDALGGCRCGKKATGVYCDRCAAARIKKADRDREKGEREAAIAMNAADGELA
jgi:hypothetical protein